MESNLTSEVVFKNRTQPWQLFVCLGIGAYLALGVATDSVRSYHWFMLAAIPAALLSAERGRRFFADLAPLFAFWLLYDRLRLIQTLLYPRVAVETPYQIEQWAFGWLATGSIPAHSACAWLNAHTGLLAKTIDVAAQSVYFSHLFVVPLFIFALWVAGASRDSYRQTFLRHIRAFTILNFSGIALYLLLPVAPPWWVTLNGMAQPTPELVAQVKMSSAMHGTLIQGMIRNAALWFGAVPSLHGAYPVLLMLLSLQNKRKYVAAAFAVYAGAMWIASVILNQHYIIDLLVGALLAVAAWSAAVNFEKFRKFRFRSEFKLQLADSATDKQFTQNEAS